MKKPLFLSGLLLDFYLSSIHLRAFFFSSFLFSKYFLTWSFTNWLGAQPEGAIPLPYIAWKFQHEVHHVAWLLIGCTLRQLEHLLHLFRC